MELFNTSSSIAAIKDIKQLPDEKLQIYIVIFSIELKISRLLSSPTKAPIKTIREGMRLLKISVLKFDGHILQWQSFWEQFELYAHNRAELSDAVKLAYLRDSLNDGPALNIMKGLAKTTDNYGEVVCCFQQRYDRQLMCVLS